MRAPSKRTRQRKAPATLFARINSHIALETHPDGGIVARFGQNTVSLGKLSAGAVERAQNLSTGLPFSAFASDGSNIGKEVDRLVRRLARHGLLEYGLARSRTGSYQVVIEPQTPDYWPQTPRLGSNEVIVLSRFSYLRRRANEMILKSPLAGALFKIYSPKIVAGLASLSTPQKIKQLRLQGGAAADELLALLVDCRILFKVDPKRANELRLAEGDDNLVLWDFHDLLFHTRSTEGRHANPLGGSYLYSSIMPSLPAVRPRWPGKKIDLLSSLDEHQQPVSELTKILRERHSTRDFDNHQPITLTELSRFLDEAARVQSKWKAKVEVGDDDPVVAYAARPYPSAGGSWELELYLSVNNCEGLARGFYHYDADRHALVPIAVRPESFEAVLKNAEFATGAPAPPQILITITARFGRVLWKYSSIAYSLILKDLGVLMQTLYVTATDMGLGGCAIGTADIDLFSKMAGIEFYVEGPIGHFTLGRGLR